MRILVKIILVLYALDCLYGFFVVIKKKYENGVYRHPCATVIAYLLVAFAVSYAAIYL